MSRAIVTALPIEQSAIPSSGHARTINANADLRRPTFNDLVKPCNSSYNYKSN